MKRTHNDMDDPRFMPAVKLPRRTGAVGFQIRYSDDEEPVVWIAVAEYNVSPHGKIVSASKKGRPAYRIGAGMTPLKAIFALCTQIVDGGECAHCHRPAGFIEDVDEPDMKMICWWTWDPETTEYVQACQL